MKKLHQIISEKVRYWRENDYSGNGFQAIAEVLEYQVYPESGGTRRFLRAPQLNALETYWYLRLVEKTPHIFDLYKGFFQKKAELIKALRIPQTAFEAADYALLKKSVDKKGRVI